MPEILEVELTRRRIESLVGDRVVRVTRTDALVVGDGVDDVVRGATVVGFVRRGKQLVIDTVGPHGTAVPVGLHLGMTGRVFLDEVSAIGELAYGSRADNERWDRWTLAMASGTTVRLHDPRRMAKVTLDPDIDVLGPDALSLRRRDLAGALAHRKAPLKAVLLDQHAIAGLGNMLVDEVLWWSSLDPHRRASSLTADDVTALHGAVRKRLAVMLRRGGSHTGTLSPQVRLGGWPCERDGAELARSVVGGRTTLWCPVHQR